jgi:hypothetical protein
MIQDSVYDDVVLNAGDHPYSTTAVTGAGPQGMRIAP